MTRPNPHDPDYLEQRAEELARLDELGPKLADDLERELAKYLHDAPAMRAARDRRDDQTGQLLALWFRESSTHPAQIIEPPPTDEDTPAFGIRVITLTPDPADEDSGD